MVLGVSGGLCVGSTRFMKTAYVDAVVRDVQRVVDVGSKSSAFL